MARFFPERPPESAPGSEVRVFDSLRELDDAFVVFHSVAWHRDRGKPDGEVDFLLAHPDLGLLAIEVKGGGVAFDPVTAAWSSTDREGVVHEIRDPFGQALAAKHALLGEILSDDRWPPGRRVQIGYAVVLPDTVVSNAGFTARGKREITFGKNDLDTLPDRVVACLRHWQSADPAEAPGAEGVRAVIERYGKSWKYQIPLRDAYRPEEQRIIELTQQQMEILYNLERHNRAAIAGCAGSGKTLLAIAKARELAGQGKRVLLTCYNAALAKHWNESLDLPPGIVARHFHGFCSDAVRAAGLQPPNRNASRAEYSDWLPTGLYDSLESVQNFDAVVVDEGQDFQQEWFESLYLLQSDEEAGVFFAFYDDNQRIYQTDAIPSWFGEPYVLSRNIRNTNEIASVVHKFYSGKMRYSGITGPEVRLEAADVGEGGRPAHVTVLTSVLRDLRTGGADPRDIVVLTPKRSSDFVRHNKLGGWRLHSRDKHDGDVLWETIHSFKGQDSSIVILTELDDLSSLADTAEKRLETLLYVGSSRARMLLIAIAPTSLIDSIGGVS